MVTRSGHTPRCENGADGRGGIEQVTPYENGRYSYAYYYCTREALTQQSDSPADDSDHADPSRTDSAL